jgi:hypothetical protein
MPIECPCCRSAPTIAAELAPRGRVRVARFRDLSGHESARATLRSIGCDVPFSEMLLDALLVASLNPPVCLTLLDADDTVADWNSLQPGLRFRSLCAALGSLPALKDGATVVEMEAWIDSACRHLHWPLHGVRFEHARIAREKIAQSPDLAAVANWLNDHRYRTIAMPPQPPPATFACTQYVAFLDAFLASRGGLLRTGTMRVLCDCRPREAVDPDRTPLLEACGPERFQSAGSLSLVSCRSHPTGER